MGEAARLISVQEAEDTGETTGDAGQSVQDVAAQDVAAQDVAAQDNAVPGSQKPALTSERAPRTALMRETMRIAEAMVFAAESPLDESEIRKRMPEGLKVADVMHELRLDYQDRGVNLVRVGSKWTFRTAQDLGWLLSRETQQQKKLSRAALETLSIIAYHQPVTRAEIEDIRGVAISKGTLDVLMETGWVRLRGRRKAPGRPVTYGTTDDFLLHFGLEGITDLPGLDELKGAGLFDGRLPAGFGVPTPNDSSELSADEDPLEDGDLLAFAGGGVPEDDAAAEAQTPEVAAALADMEAAAEASGETGQEQGSEPAVDGGAESQPVIQAGMTRCRRRGGSCAASQARNLPATCPQGC